MPREEDEFALSYYNSMTTWIDVDRLLNAFGLARSDLPKAEKVTAAIRTMSQRMPTYVTLKDVKKRWGHGQEDIFPVTQFEKLWGDMTAWPEINCKFVAVPRLRGQQLKDPLNWTAGCGMVLRPISNPSVPGRSGHFFRPDGEDWLPDRISLCRIWPPRLAVQAMGPPTRRANAETAMANQHGMLFSSAEQDKPPPGGHTQNHQTSESKLRDLFMLCEECVRNAGQSFHRLFSRLAGEICRNAQDGNDNEHTEATRVSSRLFLN